ncbi:MAG: hypothetical protein HOP29_00605 [Phycisphaerales bacterium]|nr:hypothetical protein [Phycisphaerales bacterium]
MATKIKIDSHLHDRVRAASEAAGYASVEEFVMHVLEKEVSRLAEAGDDAGVIDRLKGLGYLE